MYRISWDLGVIEWDIMWFDAIDDVKKPLWPWNMFHEQRLFTC